MTNIHIKEIDALIESMSQKSAATGVAFIEEINSLKHDLERLKKYEGKPYFSEVASQELKSINDAYDRALLKNNRFQYTFPNDHSRGEDVKPLKALLAEFDSHFLHNDGIVQLYRREIINGTPYDAIDLAGKNPLYAFSHQLFRALRAIDNGNAAIEVFKDTAFEDRPKTYNSIIAGDFFVADIVVLNKIINNARAICNRYTTPSTAVNDGATTATQTKETGLG